MKIGKTKIRFTKLAYSATATANRRLAPGELFKPSRFIIIHSGVATPEPKEQCYDDSIWIKYKQI